MPADPTRQLFNRLRYIEGQAQGIRRMILSGRPGAEVLVQLQAIESAATGARELFVRQQIENELREQWRERLAAHLATCTNAADIAPLLYGEPEPQPAKRHRARKPPAAAEDPAQDQEGETPPADEA